MAHFVGVALLKALKNPSAAAAAPPAVEAASTVMANESEDTAGVEERVEDEYEGFKDVEEEE